MHNKRSIANTNIPNWKGSWASAVYFQSYLLHTITFLSPPWTSNEYPQQKSEPVPCIPIKTPCPQHSLKDFTALTILHDLHKYSHHIMSYTYCMCHISKIHIYTQIVHFQMLAICSTLKVSGHVSHQYKRDK